MFREWPGVSLEGLGWVFLAQLAEAEGAVSLGGCQNYSLGKLMPFCPCWGSGRQVKRPSYEPGATWFESHLRHELTRCPEECCILSHPNNTILPYWAVVRMTREGM